MPVKSNFVIVEKDFKNFQKELFTNIIPNSMDDILQKDFNQFKKQVSKILTEKKVFMPEVIPEKTSSSLITKVPKVEKIGAKDLIVQELANISLADYNTKSAYSSYYQSGNDESKLLVVNKSKSVFTDGRITLRIPINPGDTVQSQYAISGQFFSQSVFGFDSGRGNIEYIIPPENAFQDRKIKCSTQSGDGDEATYGFSPEERFERDRDTKNYAEWTLFQEDVLKIRQDGINLSAVADYILNQDFDSARSMLGANVNTSSKVKEILNRVENIEKEQEINPSTQQVQSIAKYFHNLTLVKTKRKSYARYEIYAPDKILLNSEVRSNLEQEISLWKSYNTERWFSLFVKKLTVEIRRFFNK